MRSPDEAYHALEPWLEEREARRKAAVRRFVLGAVVALVAAVALGGGLALLAMPDAVVAIAAIAGALLAMGWGSAPLRALHREIKHGLNTRLAAAFGLSYAPEPASPARFDSFREHGLVPACDRRSFEDHFAGHAHGARFELYEAHLKQKRRSKNRTYYVTVFRGVLIRIAFPRTIEGVTLVTRDKGIFNALEGWTKKTFSGRGLERVGLVDPDFERYFEVYATDQVMSRYLLTPSFMERLLKLEATLQGKKIRCVFDEALGAGDGEGELLIAAETGDRFEPGSMFSPLADRARVDTLHAEIAEIDAIIATVLEPAKLDERPS
ncbi:DUF3137 domain-containing protein [Marinicauda algicola]|uniref:DUF3137 domain-containing protein n=1 Tax=Marinicauda algicola TaxID=2029849 RepID=A0A4S2GZ30_9PROT|nr:DUF3137 domain-containing protein [Marinicauda algicola]TGY88396.1 DUF3137 domain-containing protein [Marinicauda algicola]